MCPHSLYFFLFLFLSLSDFRLCFFILAVRSQNPSHLPPRRRLPGRAALHSLPHIQIKVRTCSCHGLRLSDPWGLCCVCQELGAQPCMNPCPLALRPRAKTRHGPKASASRAFRVTHLAGELPLPVATAIATPARPMSSSLVTTRRSHFYYQWFPQRRETLRSLITADFFTSLTSTFTLHNDH